ncbi:hypothetical protein ABZT26_25810 [Streptomyces sp. NPDC005395]|uniref:hypothetical protein n=1 Tax=Streptomyces sp. NPDC005395 TaxID=3157042 RepID=UPI0033A0801D
MTTELITDPSRLAVYIVKNKTRAEDALFELANSLVQGRGELDAYRDTAAALVNLPRARRGWLNRDREREVLRIAGDMRELVGLPRVEYADPMPFVRQMAATSPLGPDFVLNAYAQELKRCGY